MLYSEKRRVQRDIKARQRKQTINEFTNNSSISDRQWRGRMKREDRTKQQQNPSPGKTLDLALPVTKTTGMYSSFDYNL